MSFNGCDLQGKILFFQIHMPNALPLKPDIFLFISIRDFSHLISIQGKIMVLKLLLDELNGFFETTKHDRDISFFLDNFLSIFG